MQNEVCSRIVEWRMLDQFTPEPYGGGSECLQCSDQVQQFRNCHSCTVGAQLQCFAQSSSTTAAQLLETHFAHESMPLLLGKFIKSLC
eukprot:4854954-Amphidinium_carterae.1